MTKNMKKALALPLKGMNGIPSQIVKDELIRYAASATATHAKDKLIYSTVIS
jgi:hypothetical protein